MRTEQPCIILNFAEKKRESKGVVYAATDDTGEDVALKDIKCNSEKEMQQAM